MIKGKGTYTRSFIKIDDMTRNSYDLYMPWIYSTMYQKTFTLTNKKVTSHLEIQKLIRD